MEDLIKMIGDYGVTIIIVALFIWDWICNKKKINETLEQNAECLKSIQETNLNTSSSLELLKESMNTQKEFLFKHDQKSEKIEEDLKEIRIKLEKKGGE